MSVCLFVCSASPPKPCEQMKPNFPEILYRPRTECCGCYSQSMKLTNRIAAFRDIKLVGSEGDQSLSDRSCTRNHAFCLWIYLSILDKIHMGTASQNEIP